MSWSFRRHVNIGPFRVNLSKSGVGVSFGAKGARLSMGPRGTFVNVGSHGVYYRQQLSSNRKDVQPVRPESATDSDFCEIPTARACELKAATSSETLDTINQRIAQMPAAPWVLAATVGIMAGCYAFLSPAVALPSIVITTIAGCALGYCTHLDDIVKRTTPLFFEQNSASLETYKQLRRNFENLSSAQRIWRINWTQSTEDWKRNAGASSLLRRKRCSVQRANLPFIATNVDVFALDVGDMKLFFLPDHVFVWHRRTYGSVAYDDIRIDFEDTVFIEEEAVPSDSMIIDYTWRFVRKDGGPDRRFSNNCELPRVAYGQLTLTSQGGLNLYLQVSNRAVAEEFAAQFNKISQKLVETDGVFDEYVESSTHSTFDHQASETLGIRPNATFSEVSAAYRRLASEYHPDRVAHMAIEFQELAKRRMSEINAAYEKLKTENADVAPGSTVNV